MKIVDKQTLFNTGILTNKLRARDDLKQYSQGVADAYNFICSKYGPIVKRVGTLFKYDAGHVGEKVFLLPFIFSIKQSLVLEFLANKIRFYTFNGVEFGLIEDPNNPGQPYTVSTPFTEDQLEHISYAQSLDVIYLAIPGGETRPKELRRRANDDWELVDFTFEDGPYLDQNYDSSKKVKVDKTETGSVTVTAEGFTFNANDKGRHIRISHMDSDSLEDRWGWGVITAISEDRKSATVDMKEKAWSTDATSDFRLGAWGGSQGWPTLCTIHEQRLVWAGVTNYPWIWMSNSFNYHKYSPSDYNGNIKDTNAISYNMSTDKVADVKWLASLGSLLIGTEMYEMRMYSAGAGLAPGDCVVRKETTYGVHDSLPVITDDTLIFIQRLQRTLRSVSYDYTRDAYAGPALSILAESLTIAGMKKIIHQREPYDIVWILLEDGKLLAMTYDKEQDVVAWSRVEIAGKDARVVDFASIPSAVYRQDMVVMLVERTIMGHTRRYLELLSREFLDDVAMKDAVHLDSAMRYQGEETTSIRGLEHLNGEQVRVMNRGGIQQDAYVSDGEINIKYPIKDGWIGLPYKASFETLERDVQEKQLSVKIGKVRIHKLILYMLRTLGTTVTQKTRGMTTQLITFTPKSNMDTPPEPMSGQKEHDVMSAWTSFDLAYSLVFESEPGLPCTIGGIYAGLEINPL